MNSIAVYTKGCELKESAHLYFDLDSPSTARD